MNNLISLWNKWLEQKIILPQDTQSERLRKVVTTSGIISGVSATIVWAIILYLIGFQTIGIILAIVSLIFIIDIVLVFKTRNFELFYNIVLILTMLNPFVMQFLLGGFARSGFVSLWALMAIMGPLLVLDKKKAYLWLSIFVFLMLISALLDEKAGQVGANLSDFVRTVIFTWNGIFISLLLFFVFQYVFQEIETARNRADTLLLNILPASIADRLKQNPQTIADKYEEVTILFADIVDSTRLAAEADPVDVVKVLNEIFGDFDKLAEKYKLEKIKTIGDAYMVAAGLPEFRADHIEAIMLCAIEMLNVIKKHTAWNGEPIKLRIGINTGPVVAGVIGTKKFIYDLWGDTVNVASRMESNGLTNSIHVTESVRQALSSYYKFEAREPIFVKGKGQMSTYVLVND